MEREVAGLIRLCGGQAKGLHDHNFRPPPFAFHITGVGKEKATAGVMALMDAPEKPDAILTLGFAGGLHGALATGDLALSRRLYATGEDAFLEADPELLRTAQEALAEAHLSARLSERRARHFVSDTLTVPRMVCSASEKGVMAASTRAWAVNMEDYWIGQAALRAGIPFLSVRSVLDTANQDVPPFTADIGDKSLPVQALLVVAHGIARPRNMLRVANLAKQAKAAQESLASLGISFLNRIAATGRIRHSCESRSP
jgi:adenosylhomocysteine nucleosidase